MLSFIASFIGKILSRKLGLKRRKMPLPKFGAAITPPGGDYHGYRGFVSSTRNEWGMQAKFFIDERTGGACCTWTALPHFESFPSLIHGGIGFSLLDELMGHAVYVQCGHIGVTAKAKTKWLGALRTSSEINGSAVVVRKLWRLVKVKGWILDDKGKILISSSAVFYLPSRKQMNQILNDPNIPEETLQSCL